MSHDNLGFTSSTDALDTKKWVDSSTNNRTSFDSGQKKGNVYVLEMEEKKKSVQECLEDYNPYEHRDVEHPTTNMETFIHLLKGSLGTGILAMPNAFHHSGYAVGIVATIVIGLLCTYCIRILVSSEYELCKRKKVPSLTYPATAEAALLAGPAPFRRFAKTSIHVINVFLMVYQLGTCCVYTVFIGKNLHKALDPYMPNVDVRLYMLAMLLPLILVNWIRNLKFLAPCSTIANCITFASFGIILYYIFREPLSFENREPIGHVANFPLYFGTVLFALEAIGVIMPLENEMKKPKYFMKSFGVLNIGMGTIVALYTMIGFFGYIRYGSNVYGSITLNLVDEPKGLALSVQVLLSLAIFFHSSNSMLRSNRYRLERVSRAKYGEKFSQTPLGVRRKDLTGSTYIPVSYSRSKIGILHITVRCSVFIRLGLDFPRRHSNLHVLERVQWYREDLDVSQEHILDPVRIARPRGWNVHESPGHRRRLLLNRSKRNVKRGEHEDR